MELHSKKEQSYRLHPDIVIFPSLLSISQCSFLMWYLCCIFFSLNIHMEQLQIKGNHGLCMKPTNI